MSQTTLTMSEHMGEPCDECGLEYNEEKYVGCCRDGRCPLSRDFLCSTCGTYDEKLQCILCPECMKNYEKVFEEDKEYIE